MYLFIEQRIGAFQRVADKRKREMRGHKTIYGFGIMRIFHQRCHAAMDRERVVKKSIVVYEI